jgi:hypothetical protein
MKTGHVAAALLGLTLVGCGPEEAGSGSSPGAGGAHMDVDAGAGSDASSTVSTVDKFVGTWKYGSGAMIMICAGESWTFSLAGEDEEFAHAVGGGLTLKGVCALKLGVAGDTATGTGATCTQVNNDGSSTSMTFTGLTYTTTDGLNMTIAASGNLAEVVEGQSLACTFSISGTLTKYAN